MDEDMEEEIDEKQVRMFARVVRVTYEQYHAHLCAEIQATLDGIKGHLPVIKRKVLGSLPEDFPEDLKRGLIMGIEVTTDAFIRDLSHNLIDSHNDVCNGLDELTDTIFGKGEVDA